MIKKSLVLALLAGLVASSSVALATPVDFFLHEYSVYAIADNAATGEWVQDNDTSQKGTNVSATCVNASATASAKNNGYLLYADANVENKDTSADSAASAYLCFVATCTDVRLKFDYGTEADTAGNATAGAVILIKFTDYENKLKTIFDLTTMASSDGTLLESDANSYSGTFNKVLHSLELGKAYGLALEVHDVYAEACSDTSAAHACGWISDLIVKNLDPPAVPLPGASLLLASGLMRLLVWARRKQS